MTATNTTRPLFHLAQEHNRDYTDVLNVAWGLKQLITGSADAPNVYYGPSLNRIMCDGGGEACFCAIQRHVTEFVALQGSALHPLQTADFDVIEARVLGHMGVEFPDDPGCRDV